MSSSSPDEVVRSGGERAGWLGWWRERGATFQAAVPGLYAWAVTVAPVGWSRGASAYAAITTTTAVLSLLVGPAVERCWPDAARMATGWGLVMSSVATWTLAPEPALASFDAGRGIAGMFGWGMFAFAVASPSTSVRAESLRVVTSPGTSGGGRTDAAIFSVGLLLAVALQVPGWRVAQRDRTLLVRLVALAAGLTVLNLASAIALGRRPADNAARRLRLTPAAGAWLALALALVGAGLAFGAGTGPS